MFHFIVNVIKYSYFSRGKGLPIFSVNSLLALTIASSNSWWSSWDHGSSSWWLTLWNDPELCFSMHWILSSLTGNLKYCNNLLISDVGASLRSWNNILSIKLSLLTTAKPHRRYSKVHWNTPTNQWSLPAIFESQSLQTVETLHSWESLQCWSWCDSS